MRGVTRAGFLALLASCGPEAEGGPVPADAATDAAGLDAAAAGDGVNAPPERRADLEPGPFLPLTADGQAILDAAGRQVILRGLEHHALQDVDYVGREVGPEDYARIASWGFTMLRLAISWSRIEPERGRYDDEYVAQIADALDRAEGAGLAALVEWHQDLWGRCSQADDSTFRVNANGAPDWTCPDDYVPSLLGHWELFDRLWANEDGLGDAFLDAWQVVIDSVGEHPALLGYDVINEPQGSGGSPAFERDRLFPALGAIVPDLRARGARGLLVLDAPALRNETFEMWVEPLGHLGPDLVFAPHLYSGWMRMYLARERVPPEDKAADFAAAEEQAAGLGLALWNGEWGVNLSLNGAIADLETHVASEDAARIGSSYWAFQRAVPGQGDDSISGGQSLLDEDGDVRQDVLDRLSRPYPIQSPGRLSRVAFDFETARLDVELDAETTIDAPLVLYAPARILGPRSCLTVDGPGDWSWDELRERELVLVGLAAEGRWSIRLERC
ncbi:MAG: cellulase family glycosylhydrolase [Deltaproteobacteria bacterium]|nr:cellulase family glycosylhydrolase [Deltaproteobacteria bacterium]